LQTNNSSIAFNPYTLSAYVPHTHFEIGKELKDDNMSQLLLKDRNKCR